MDIIHHKLTRYEKMLLRVRALNIFQGALIGFVLASLFVFWQIDRNETRRLALQDLALHPKHTEIGGPFHLVTTSGEPFTEKNLIGKYSLVYFGYSFCPDVCPTGLESMARLLEKLGPNSQKVQAIFVTIDPSRDTPEVLENYVASFNGHIIALRGSDEETSTMTEAYQVYFTKKPSEDGADQYTLDHTTFIYLMDPEGKFVSAYAEDVDADALLKALETAPH